MLRVCTLLVVIFLGGAAGQLARFTKNTITLSQKYKGFIHLNEQGKVMPLVQNLTEKEARDICVSLGFYHGSLLKDELLPKLDENIKSCATQLSCKSWIPISCTFKTTTCNYYQLAKIRCENALYRVDGGGKDHGEFQVKINGEWGRVCSRYFTPYAAKLACQAIGYEEGVVSSTAYSTSVKSFVGNMKCAATAKHIRDCTWTPNVCYKKIGIRCFNLKVRLSPLSPSPQMGTVEVLFNGQWGGICYNKDSNIHDLLARMLSYTKGEMYEVIYTRTLLQSSKCVGNESSLAQCPGLVWSTSCASKKMLGLKLSRDIRLASHTPSRGRVEILHNQVWGGICGDKWTKEDATVTCKNLGFIKGKVLPHQKRHSGKVWLSEMRCTNNDTYLLNCPHDSWGFIGCSSTDRAAVQCFRHDIRLRGGSKPNEGRVEFKKNGIWGTLCDSDWDNDDATVLCRDLGYSQGTAYKGWKFGPGKGPIFHENVDCVGDELTFEQCFLQDWLGGSKCDHSHDVGVACFNEKIRLTGVDLENKGAVEVSYGNGWGRVCSDHWDNVKANVLCRSLGYETGLSHQDNPYRQNTGTSLPVLLNVGDCNGNETSIFECSRLPNEKCNYAGAGVTCFKVDISEKFLPDNRIVVNYDGKIGTLCPKESWTWVEATTVCRMKGYMKGFAIEKPETTSYPVALSNISCTGKELSLDECSNDERSYEHCDRSSNLHVHCANVEARIDGRVNNATVGLVQVLYNGLWGSVCNTGWNDDAAEVFCRSLGYCNGAMVSKYVSHIPVKNTHQFWLDNITCSGNETSLEECKHSSWGDAYCDQEDSAAAWCSNYVGIRLKDGKSKHEGRVEILHNGMWGSICDDSWDDNDARVVCRMLGYSYGRATLQSQHGLTNGEIWLDEVDCNGRELSIESCRHLEWGWHNCDHNEDAGVICSHNPTSIIG